MAPRIYFRKILPICQTAATAFFGVWGLWQRSAILSRPFPFWTTGWQTTARFHVWPWPYKYAVVSNFPAFLAGLLSSWPIEAAYPKLPEIALLAPSLLFVFVLWSWVGAWLDNRWTVTEKLPWVALAFFAVACLCGALLPSRYAGYTGFLPYGLLVWLVMAALIRLASKAHTSDPETQSRRL